MNVERILEIANKIESLEHDTRGSYFNGVKGFNMNLYSDSCGSPACIAGWTVHMYNMIPKTNTAVDREDYIFDTATELLGITKPQSHDLFTPYKTCILADITPQEAATTLRKLAETGEVDWSHAASFIPE